MAYENFVGDGKFAQGVVRYLDLVSEGYERRIAVPVEYEHVVRTVAVVDTGAPWSILDPLQAVALNLQPDVATESVSIAVRGAVYQGFLYQVLTSLHGETGTRLNVESVVFIPTLYPDEEWRLPNFLGLQGFLERIRFAVDPAENQFYFAGLNSM